MPKFKVKRLTPTAKLPEKTHATDTGWDLFVDRVENGPGREQLTVYTGLAIQPDPGFYAQIYPRSSVAKKKLQLANSVGIIDEDYRGEIRLVFNKIPDGAGGYDGGYYLTYPLDCHIAKGEKIAQLVVCWRFDTEWEEVTDLGDTARGAGGFGSTGK